MRHHDDEAMQQDKREAQRRATHEVNKRLDRPPLRSKWRHRGTGNEYRVEALSHGSGELHGHIVVHYRRTNIDSELFSRLLLEWDGKMERMS